MDLKQDEQARKRSQHSLEMFGEGTRGRILRGTAVSVSRRGVRDITVQHILEASEVSRRTFYKTFQSAEDALDALFEVSTRMFAGSIHMAAAGEPDPLRRIICAVDAYLDLQQVGGRLIMELQFESIRPDSLLGPRRERLFDMLVELFDNCVNRIVGRPVDPLLVRGAMLSLEGLVLHIQREGVFTDESRHRVRRVFLATLAGALNADEVGEFELPHPPATPARQPSAS